MIGRIFENYQEFFSLTKPLSDFQRETLLQSLSPAERRRLLRAFKIEGWNDLHVRNKIDRLLDQVKEDFDEDLVFIRIQVLSGTIKKVRKAFWNYVNDVFKEYSVRHKWHIFEGITAKEHNKEWVLLVPSRRSNNGENNE